MRQLRLRLSNKSFQHLKVILSLCIVPGESNFNQLCLQMGLWAICWCNVGWSFLEVPPMQMPTSFSALLWALVPKVEKCKMLQPKARWWDHCLFDSALTILNLREQNGHLPKWIAAVCHLSTSPLSLCVCFVGDVSVDLYWFFWYIVFDNLIIAYQAPSDVWRHPCISGYGGQRLPNVTQRDLPLP